MMAVPGYALAQGNSTCQSYNGETCQAVSNANASRSPSGGNTGSNAGNSTVAASASTLPFTGLDVVLLAVGGGTLLGAGLVVRRLSRS